MKSDAFSQSPASDWTGRNTKAPRLTSPEVEGPSHRSGVARGPPSGEPAGAPGGGDDLERAAALAVVPARAGTERVAHWRTRAGQATRV